jgi:hypothetical protein
MRGQTGDPYARLLGEWQDRREKVNAYHRALRFLMLASGEAPQWQQWQRERWRELNEQLVMALIALRQASKQLRRYEQGRAAASPR